MSGCAAQYGRSGIRWSRLWLALVALLPALAGAGDASRNNQADALTAALPVAAYALTAINADPQGAREATWSLGMTVAGTLALNALIDKDTPNGDDDDAFPSGHSAVAFGSAAFMQRRYGWGAGLPAYAVAGYVGWLRVETDEHDWADVLGGAALGIGSAWLFTHRWSERVAFTPWLGSNGAGLAVHARW